MRVSNILFAGYKGWKQNYNFAKKQKTSAADLIRESIQNSYSYTDGQKKQLDTSIETKLKSGKKLTSEEMQYLQKKDPVLYMKVLMMQKKREVLEKKLKNCRSKNEVETVVSAEMNLVGEKDPDRDMKLKVIQDAAQEFKKSAYYERLPETDRRS